jgi:hypothetical protein
LRFDAEQDHVGVLGGLGVRLGHVDVMRCDQFLAAREAGVRADDVARLHEVAFKEPGEHRLGHHAGADDSEAYPPEAFCTHVTPHLTVNESPAGSTGHAMIEADEPAPSVRRRSATGLPVAT